MNITKYGHACLFLENETARIVIDPGEFTELPEDMSNIAAVIVTHPHGDHLSVANLQKIASQSPGVQVLGVQEAINEFDAINVEKTAVQTDMDLTISGFEVTLYVGDHEVIYKASPCKNIGVRIGSELYYPGDSLRVIDEKVRIVAVPVSAPWLKSSEYIDFTLAMNPEIAFPTHNGLLNDVGHEVMNNWLKTGIKDTNIDLRVVKNGELV